MSDLNTSERAEILEQYVSNGYQAKLIPLHKWDFVDARGTERGKSPRDARWRDANYSLEDLRGAVRDEFNVGFRLSSEDLVVDMDPRNMQVSLEDAIDFLESNFGVDLHNAPRVITGGGGLHIYLRVPAARVGEKFRNELAELPGVEFKAHGKQVVAAGSKHPSGKFYLFAEGKGLDLVAFASEGLLDAITKVKREQVQDAPTDITPAQLEVMLQSLDVQEFADNDKWIQLAMSCYHATQGTGEQVFVDWSMSDPNYSNDEEMVRMRWQSLEGGEGVTAATLFKYVTDAGRGDLLREDPSKGFEAAGISERDQEVIDRPVEMYGHGAENGVDDEGLFMRNREGQILKNARNTMAAIEQMGLHPTRNALKDEIHIEGDLSELQKFYPMADGTFDDSMIHGVRNCIIYTYDFEPTTTQVHEALLAMALRSQYHPVRDYLNSLTWDGTPRIGSFLAEYCGAPNNPYVSKVGEILLKAAVGRAMKPGTKFDTMVILEGVQGCGKSTLVKVLGGEWTLEGLPNKQDLNHKDVIQAIQGYWMVEVEELAVMRKSDVDSLKAFITRQTDKARFAYAKEAKTYHRQCVFVGTTNDDEYLLDSTGNRRFLPVEVGVIDLAGVKVIRDQLWAEAVVLWNANPTDKSLQMPESLWGDAAEQQEDRRVQDPVEFKVREFLNGLEPDTDFVTIPELLWGVLHKASSDAEMKDTRRINRAFKTIPEWQGARRGSGSKRIRGYERRAV